MRVATASKELLGQRNQGESLAEGLSRLRVGHARPRRPDSGAANRLLHADRGRTREHELMSSLALASKSLVGGVLRQQPAEVGLRPKVARRGKAIQSEIASLGALQRVVPFVADVGEPGTAHSGRKRERSNLAWSKSRREICGPHPAEIEAVGDRTGPRPRAWLFPRAAKLLAQVDLPFHPLRSESRNIQAVVVEDGIDQLELIVIEQLRNFVADESPLLQPPNVGLERHRPIPAQEIQSRHIKTHSGAESGRTLRPGSSRLKFQSNPVGEGIAFRLFHLYQDIFLWIGAVRVLHGCIHLAEDAQIVEPGLGVQHALLAEWIARLYLQFALHHIVAGMLRPGYHHAVHCEAVPFHNGVTYVFAIGLAGQLGGDVKRGVG